MFQGVDVGLGVGGRDPITINTRSVFDLLEILSACIDVPEQDIRDGAATAYPPSGLVGGSLRVAFASERPERVAVAVKYRDGWFYISDTDRATKRFFRLLGTLWTVAMTESTAGVTAAPVLTVPVSR